ncbi:Heat shock like protein [Astathelohania contejeani]|uniref:Heat shock like protein n=1 Tax=Astathelohania contejeani TaxID=164912 RepID=A0ABQ7I289_9MICR|nr:Heat shock like protein [Thelohania contejeani]
MTTIDKKKTSTAIGIDLGTTYSCVAGYINGKLEVIPNSDGERTTPSVVAFDENERRLIGSAAQSIMSVDAKNVFYDVKRMIGRGYDDPKLSRALKNWPFEVVRYDNVRKCEVGTPSDKDTVDNIKIKCTRSGLKYYDPVEISSFILNGLKKAAEAKLGHSIDAGCITVPAHFNDNQREKTKIAATVAGFKNVRLLNEPTAAAMAYGYGRSKDEAANQKEETILVFDLGGGTFDVSILRFEAASEEGGIAEVITTDGDTFLGGVDFDNALFDYAMQSFFKSNPSIKPEKITDKAKRRLRTACEKAKRSLSNATSAYIDIDCFCSDIDFKLNVTRSNFENLCAPYFRRCAERVRGCLLGLVKQSTNYTADGTLITGPGDENIIQQQKDKINKVILVGGSSRVPKIREDLEKMFGASKLCYSIHPDEAVALGAAYQAAMLAGDADLKASDTILLLDTVPLNIGIETAGGVSTTIIPRKTTIPTKMKQVFTTASDNQSTVSIVIFEGNRAMTKDNHKLGEFNLSGIPPAPAGVPQIEVTCDVDNNGILTVEAVDLQTKNKQKISVESLRGKGFSQEDIDKMVEDAKKYEEVDRLFREKMDARNELERNMNAISTLVENNKGLDEAIKDNIKNKITEIRNWVESNPGATKEDYESKNKEVMELKNQLGVGSGSGGFPGGFPGGFTGGSNGGASTGGNDGPTVEEVD